MDYIKQIIISIFITFILSISTMENINKELNEIIIDDQKNINTELNKTTIDNQKKQNKKTLSYLKNNIKNGNFNNVITKLKKMNFTKDNEVLSKFDLWINEQVIDLHLAQKYQMKFLKLSLLPVFVIYILTFLGIIRSDIPWLMGLTFAASTPCFILTGYLLSKIYKYSKQIQHAKYNNDNLSPIISEIQKIKLIPHIKILEKQLHKLNPTNDISNLIHEEKDTIQRLYSQYMKENAQLNKQLTSVKQTNTHSWAKKCVVCLEKSEQFNKIPCESFHTNSDCLCNKCHIKLKKMGNKCPLCRKKMIF